MEDYEEEEEYFEEQPDIFVEKAELDFFKETTESKMAELQSKVDTLINSSDLQFVNYVSVAAVCIALLAAIVSIFVVKAVDTRISKIKEHANEQAKKSDKRISELKMQISDLEEHIKKLTVAQKPSQIFTPPPVQPIKLVKTEPPPDKDKIDDFVKEFNALAKVSGAEARKVVGDFISRFKICAFDCVNAEVRINEPVPPPKFADAESVRSGNYWAFEFEPELFAVVPNIKVYTDNCHTQQAMGEIFKTNFESGKVYNSISVEKPAIFKGKWLLQTQGTLTLA